MKVDSVALETPYPRLGNFCRVIAEPRRKNTKREVLKGKKRERKKRGGG
jgi:hypothetical protein